MAANPFFEGLLHDMRVLHDRKNHDYAQDSNPYSNFERAAHLVSWFTEPTDQVFACMIGIKLARLAELRSGKSPKNEAITDTYMDLAIYAALWASYDRRREATSVVGIV